MKRLAHFLDETWNHPDSRTNAYDLWERTADRGSDGALHLKKYVARLGAARYEKIRGGAFGPGLSRKVQESYRWRVENCQDGGQIFVFGFSREAYTARSVVGFMSRCGPLRSLDGPIKLDRLIERYKAGKRHPTILGLRDLKKLQAIGQRQRAYAQSSCTSGHALRVRVDFGTRSVPSAFLRGRSGFPGTRRSSSFTTST